MDSLSLNQLLTIYAWFPLVALLFIILLIARFYQKLTGDNTHYPLFGVPIVLYGVAAAHYADVNQVMDDATGDLLMFAGGLILALLCVALYRQMTTGR